ncbi:MAG: hypothetical protein AB7S26_38025 [Sandaracinaceae bacterium]
MNARLRLGARAITVVGILLAVIAVRVVTSSRAEYYRAEQLAARGDVDGAILGYRRAARWYVPGNPFCDHSLERLDAIGRSARAEGDLDRAIRAHRAARGAILASRSFYVPHRAELARAEAEIVSLTAEMAPAAERDEVRARTRDAFSAPERPSLLWTLLLLVGWLGWTLGAFAFAIYAIDDDDRLKLRPAQIWGTVVVVGLGLFALGLAMA